ncbi:radical SAM protein [Lagierella sp.]|uniref:radical SAM protein n=1 Tax=Lagierella sp. TaxID=2849657 RepID=UPI0026347D13|nr:radical SAM protein [Lagierella sp.]
MGITVKWDITYKCNLNCRHCINGDFLNKSKEELTYNEILDIIDSISNEVEIDYIHFLGGEPTVRTDFFDICKYLNENQIHFGFNTNCLKLKGELLNKLKNLKYLDCITISLEGPNEKINDQIRGKRVFRKIKKSIDEINKFTEKKPKITINTVVSKLNYKHIKEIIEFCIFNEISELTLLELVEIGNAQGENMGLSYNQKWEVLKCIDQKLKESSTELKIIPKFVRQLTIDAFNIIENGNLPNVKHGCGAGLDFVFIDNRGNCFSCDGIRNAKLQENDLNIVEKDFKYAWHDKSFSQIFEKLESEEYNKTEPCINCLHFKKSCIPCPLEIAYSENLECRESYKRMNRTLYNNLEISRGAIRFANSDGKYHIHHINTNTTLELNSNAYNLVKSIYLREITSWKDCIENPEFKSVPRNEITEFLSYLKDEKIIK